MSSSPHIAIVGATGAVGREMLACLAERSFPLSRLTLLASARSAGQTLRFRDEEIEISELTPRAFKDIDIALFSAGGSISSEFAPIAANEGCIVIDNSSAFRMDPDVPLVVPEINPGDARHHPRNIIANPNCSTIITMMGLAPLHRAFGLEGIIASTYQAVSGSGAQGIVELESQMQSLATGNPVVTKIYPHQIAHNVIPHVDVFEESGYTKEEQKMLFEGRKILGIPDLKVTCTCVSVPVMRSHSISLTAIFASEPSLEAARAALSDQPGLKLVDDPSRGIYPVPLNTTGKDDCEIGRLRKDQVLPKSLALWIVGDQVRKGAALNAVQIAEIL
jgi:aspartate-semialdehyde dehydrogenase